MTKVKYPSKKEIHAQVKDIIERSEIFDEITSNEYTECQRVSNRNDLLRTSVCVVAGIAAVAMLMIIIEPILGGANGPKKSHAYGPSSGVTGETNSDKNNNNDKNNSYNNKEDITIAGGNTEYNRGLEKINSVTMITNVRGTYKNDKISISRNYQAPMVYKEGTSFVQITKAYNEYKDRIDSYLQNKYYGNANNYAEYKDVRAEATLEVSYNNSLYTGVGNILSFTNKYNETVSCDDKSTERVAQVYYSNFDVDTGERLKLTDVFTLEEELYSAVAKAIRQEINEMVHEGLYSWQFVSDNYINESRIAKIVKEEDNWSISPSGDLVIQCNNFRTAIDANGISYGKAESFVIDKSVLIQLDKNVKYITYQ